MIILYSLFLACSVSTKAECSEETACTGFGEECIEGTCVAASCATSDQCGIEQFCNKESICEAGCAADSDCMFGDLCDLQLATCVEAECTDTKLDCGFGEFCSLAGDCYEAAGYYCQDCEDDGDCGGNGNICYGGYCGVTCEFDRDCPNGFDCLPFSDLSGNILFHQCWTACWLFEDIQ